MAYKDIPSRVFRIVLVLLLIFFVYASVTSAITTTSCNKDTCPVRFDFVTFLAMFVLTACFSVGVASASYYLLKGMVKGAWPKTKL